MVLYKEQNGVKACQGGPNYWYSVDNEFFCGVCGKTDSTQWEFTIKTHIGDIVVKSYAYCCTTCHEKNCNLCKIQDNETVNQS